MTEYRVIKSADYVTIANHHLRDSRLTMAAKGLLSLMLAQDNDGISFTVEELVESGPEGRDAIRSALRKLEDAGYIRRHQSHDADGRFGSVVMDVFEAPQTALPSTENPATGKPQTEKPSTVKQELNKEDNKSPIDSSPVMIEKKEKDKKPPKAPRQGASVPDWKPERFEGFWSFYPRGESRQAAVRAWDRLRPDDELIGKIGLALIRQKATELWQRGIGIPYASTYLNQRRWEDEITEPEDSDSGRDPEVTRWRG